jgi:hypothetical protein
VDEEIQPMVVHTLEGFISGFLFWLLGGGILFLVPFAMIQF